ncbi:MAG: hypothetical protein CVV41_08765 [Candidatus Riflebacteria bacterium HGW-Riflebacteria-1]|jgi:lipoate-protein ligase A|nr:MAG: hypothetical protein CVV41_08765 [Candidatus Riflebacteria bacterium HGW-Riflebacteria-1]
MNILQIIRRRVNISYMHKLRFIDCQTSTGAMNMAVDELLASTLTDLATPVYLRFYQWQPATISFGYNQKIERLIDIEAARACGFDLVRRMTGGKMVFHNYELTFSLGLSGAFIEQAIGRGKPFLDMFMLAVSPLVEGLKSSGVPARFASSREMQHTSGSMHCYATAAGHSIYAGNRKLVGAAGVFRQNCLTVHGSIPVLASFPPDHIFIGAQKISQDIIMAALNDFCTAEQVSELPATVARSYAEHLQLEIINRPLANNELADAEKLAGHKYNNLYWNSNPL